MNIKKTSVKHLLYFLLSYFILWVVLFEFILPVNRILPKPSVVILSFGALWDVYKLPSNFLITISSVYFGLLAAYYFLYLFRNFLIKHNHILSEFVLSLNWFSDYVPGIIFGIFLIYWFPNFSFIEFIFAFGAAFFSMLIKLKHEASKVKHEYIDSAVSLGADENIIRKKIIWNAAQPELIKHFYDLHFYIWSILIIFEFIKGQYGMGNIFREALQYQDLSALFSITIITGITIYLGTHIIHYIRNKYFHWSIF